MATLPLARPRALSLTGWTLNAEALGAFMVAVGAISRLRPALDPDLNWHLRTGQLILATHAIPRADPFSFTMAGKPWLDFEWLYEVLLAGVYSAAGLPGVIAGHALLMAGICGLVYLTLRLRRLPPLLAALGVGLTLLNLMPFAGARPGMLGAFFLASFLLVLELARARSDWRLLLALPPLQLLWVNSHGSFILGPLVCAVYGLAATLEVASARQRIAAGWVALLGGLAAACLANPAGLGLVRFVLGASRLSANSDYNGEWVAPSFHQLWAAPLLLSLLLSLALSLLSARARPDRRETLLLLVGTLAALESNQFAPLYAIAAAPVLAGLIARCIERPLRTRLTALHGAMFALVLALIGGLAVRSLQPAVYETALDKEFPVAAVGYIQQHDLQGPMWNEFDWGSYLIGALPRLPVFIDGRTELYGDAFFKTYYDVSAGQADPRPVLERYGIQMALLRHKSALATELRHDSAWREAYDDAEASVFVRNT